MCLQSKVQPHGRAGENHMYVPHGVCESSQQAVLSQLEWSNVSAAGGGSVLCSASCVSGSVLFLAPFPSLSHPAVSGSGYRTLCARHPSWLHLHHTLLHPPPVNIPQHSQSLLPQFPCQTAALMQGHALAAALLSGPAHPNTTGKWLLLLLVRNQWS